MDWWKRNFGIHPLDVIAHFVVGGLAAAALDEWTHTDAITLLWLAVVVLAYDWRRRRAIEVQSAGGMTSGEVKLAELDAQAEELHELRTRMAELEERVDFSERLLAQQREPAQIEKA